MSFITELEAIVGQGNVKQNVYTGSSTKYITFNIADDRGEVFADDTPQANIQSFQFHYFDKGNPTQNKAKIRNILTSQGFTYPVLTSQYEIDTKLNHITFECEKTE